MLETFARQIDFCTYCPKMCRFACPVANASANEGLTPWGKMWLLGRVLRGETALSPDVARDLYRCCGCRLCQTYCAWEIDVSVVLFSARQRLIPALMAPLDQECIFADEELATERIDAVDRGLSAGMAQIGVIVGQAARDNIQFVEDCLAIFRHLGIQGLRVMRIGETGYRLWAAGMVDALLKKANQVSTSISRFQRIIVLAPEDAWCLSLLYPELGIKGHPHIQHVSQFLREVIPLGLEPPVDRPVYYHDPCYLGRYLSVYEAPRQTLRSILGREPLELSWSRSSSYCCGAGGLLPDTDAELSRAMARVLVAEVADQGKGVLATYCPRCEKQFAAVTDSDEVVVRSVPSLIRAYLGAD